MGKACRLKSGQSRAVQVLADGRQRVQLDDGLGHCYCESLQLEQGLSLVRLHYQPLRPLIEESSAAHDGHVLVVTLGLQGRSAFRGRDGDVGFQAGQTTITAFRGVAGERCYAANQGVAQLRLVVERSALSKYLGEKRVAELMGDGRHLKQLGCGSSSSAAKAHGAALLRHMRNPAARLDLHIHALSLLSAEFAGLAPRHPVSSRLSAADMERIERARALLGEQLHRPLTVAWLAAAVGLNEHKLKMGFRHLFDTTPARLLLDLRMRQAMTLLEAGQQVAQVAWQVGYEYPNNFSVAFARYFGRLPGAIKTGSAQL